MKHYAILENLLHCIGDVEDRFLEEVETPHIASAKTTKRKQMVKYGAYGAAGLAVLGGAFAAYWKLRSNRLAKLPFTDDGITIELPN